MTREERKEYMKEWNTKNPNYFSQWKKDNVEKTRLHFRKWYYSEKGKEYMQSVYISGKHSEKCRRYAEKYPEKVRASSKLRKAVLCGKVIKLPCEVCGSVRSEGHHTNYLEPLKVKWMCSIHHHMEHRTLTA